MKMLLKNESIEEMESKVKINIMKENMEHVNDLIKGTKNLKLEVPKLNMVIETENWRQLHSKFFKELYDNYYKLLKAQMIDNEKHVVTRKSGIKQYRYCSKEPIEYKDYKRHYQKIYDNFYIYNYYENPQNATFIKYAVKELFKNIDEVFIIIETETENKKTQFPTRSNYKKDTEYKDAKSSGDESISAKKRESGRNAEEHVLDFLTNININFLDVANDNKYPYDIHLKDLNIGLEVKNITNGQFFISENEKRAFENERTRLCFVDIKKYLIYISKDYENSKYIQKIFEDIREIDSLIIDSYNKIYKTTEIAVAITTQNERALHNDFILINKLDKISFENLFLKKHVYHKTKV